MISTVLSVMPLSKLLFRILRSFKPVRFFITPAMFIALIKVKLASEISISSIEVVFERISANILAPTSVILHPLTSILFNNANFLHNDSATLVSCFLLFKLNPLHMISTTTERKLHIHKHTVYSLYNALIYKGSTKISKE